MFEKIRDHNSETPREAQYIGKEWGGGLETGGIWKEEVGVCEAEPASVRKAVVFTAQHEWAELCMEMWFQCSVLLCLFKHS